MARPRCCVTSQTCSQQPSGQAGNESHKVRVTLSLGVTQSSAVFGPPPPSFALSGRKRPLVSPSPNLPTPRSQNVVIVDTSNEIAGDGRQPHACIGGARRMMVPGKEQQHKVMVEAVQNHTPHVSCLAWQSPSWSVAVWGVNEVSGQALAVVLVQRGVYALAGGDCGRDRFLQRGAGRQEHCPTRRSDGESSASTGVQAAQTRSS